MFHSRRFAIENSVLAYMSKVCIIAICILLIPACGFIRAPGEVESESKFISYVQCELEYGHALKEATLDRCGKCSIGDTITEEQVNIIIDKADSLQVIMNDIAENLISYRQAIIDGSEIKDLHAYIKERMTLFKELQREFHFYTLSICSTITKIQFNRQPSIILLC